MMKFFAAFVAVVAVIATAVLASPNYGSYITYCTPTEVNFHNFKEQNCGGNYTVFSKPLGGCHKELLIFSWNGMCNSTTMQYYNYKNSDCSGNSVLTRTYEMNKCFNCPNPECKNP